MPQGGEIIEVRVSDLRRLFNAIDPSPFHDRDLDPAAEEFIVNWAREAPRSAPLALRVTLEREREGETGTGAAADLLRESVHQFFARRAGGSRRRLRELFRRGRISLVIGLGFLAVSSGLANAIDAATRGHGLAAVVREGLLIGGWVAMWRPLEIFLYDWWPIRAEGRLYDRLALMPVGLRHGMEETAEWRRDRPSVPAGSGRPKDRSPRS